MKRMYAIDANRVFLLSVVASQTLIYFVVGLGVRSDLLLQFLVQLFLALPGIYYLLVKRQPVKESLGLHPLCWKQWLLLVPLAVCIDKIALYVNVMSQLLVPNTVADHMEELILGCPFPIAFFVIAVTPALCEELIYRGILHRNYRKLSPWGAVCLSAFLFGIMHMNLNQFSYAFVIGLLFAIVNEITDSCLPGFLFHLYINGRSVILLYATANIESVNVENGTVAENLVTLLPVFLLALAGAVLFLFLLLRCKGEKGRIQSVFRGENEGVDKKEKEDRLAMVSPSLLLGILICIAFMG